MIKLSVSNIAWSATEDEQMYAYLQQLDFDGLEIAPTRVLPKAPYDHLTEAATWAMRIKDTFGLEICSMQSICFGRDESLFGTVQERESLLAYVKKAIDFAHAIGCRNLVFGSPRNRIIGNNPVEIAYEFFDKIGYYAASRHAALAFEPNPVIYGTDFITTTAQAVDFVSRVGSSGVSVNFDLGTFLHNGESLSFVAEHLECIGHIHISEPYLEVIQPREVHHQLAALLKEQQYNGYVSIEMKNPNDIEIVMQTASYIKEIFHEV